MEFIIIGVVVFGIIGFIVWASISGGKLMKQREQKLSRSEPGKAKILSFRTVGLRGQGKYGEFQAYIFSLEVSSAYKAAYNTETAWNVYQMGAPRVQAGNEVNVKIDAEDPSVVYPDVEAVEYSWNAAMLERNRTARGRQG